MILSLPLEAPTYQAGGSTLLAFLLMLLYLQPVHFSYLLDASSSLILSPGIPSA